MLANMVSLPGLSTAGVDPWATLGSRAANHGRSGPMRSRPRRNRKNPVVRAFQRETTLGPEHLIYPLFIHGDDRDVPIKAMPGCSRLCRAGLFREIAAARSVGVNSVVLFPAIPEALKSP
ncbi:MAG TPA: hypothetical protein ENJ18_04440, partial [Nannocystis exedens]|nr:hypothetical protein [Nannocystis exedens]